MLRLNFPADEKIIDFGGTDFFLKIETLPQPKLARVLFLNKHTEEECEVPEDIKCKDKKNNIENMKMPNIEYFLINYSNKYEFYYNNIKKCILNPESKSYII